MGLAEARWQTLSPRGYRNDLIVSMNETARFSSVPTETPTGAVERSELRAVENDPVAAALAAADYLALFRDQLRPANRTDRIWVAVRFLRRHRAGLRAVRR